jgi:hypothetical protein
LSTESVTLSSWNERGWIGKGQENTSWNFHLQLFLFTSCYRGVFPEHVTFSCQLHSAISSV